MKKLKMPSAIVIVFIVLIIVSILTYFVPTSLVVEKNGVNTIVYNAILDSNGNIVNNSGPSPVGIWNIVLAPVIGFTQAGPVAFTILIFGSFLALLAKVGALDAGIGSLLNKFTGNILIAILMLTFALMGTVYGSWEELPAYALIIIPLFVTAGYDVMTGLAVLFLGATIGNMASIVNPYSTGAAVAAIGNPELSLGSGISLRIIIFISLYILGVITVIRYANKVKNDKTKSVLHNINSVKTLSHNNNTLPNLTKRRLISLIVFIIMILILVLGYMPWSSIKVSDNLTMYDIVNYPIKFLSTIPFIGNFLGVRYITPLGDWYFNELSALFILGSIIVGYINNLSANEIVHEMVLGAKDLLGVVLVLAIAKGISVIMGSNTMGMSVTFVYWIQSILEGVPYWAFAIASIISYMAIGLFMQSTSGVSGITMPILGAVAFALFISTDISAIGGQIILISAFTAGINFMSCIYPGATIMGTLDIFNVPYNIYLKCIIKMLVPLLVLTAIILSVSPIIGLV